MLVETAFVKRYFWSSHLLMKLSKAERVFIDFLTEEMDENNYVSNSKLTRMRFNALIKKIGCETYSESTIHKCFSGLTKNNLLIKKKGRGLYRVSPLFFFKGSEEDRAKVVRAELEELNKIPINKLRHELMLKKALYSRHEDPL